MDLPVLRTHQSSRLLLRSYMVFRGLPASRQPLSRSVDARGQNESSKLVIKFVRSGVDSKWEFRHLELCKGVADYRKMERCTQE